MFFPRRLDAVDPNAYDAFKASRNLGDVIDRVLKNQQEASNGSGPRKFLTVEASLMTPVQPMLVSSFASHSFITYESLVLTLTHCQRGKKKKRGTYHCSLKEGSYSSF